MCSLSLSIINYACPNFRTTCTMTLMFTLQHEFEISALPSIPSNGHIGGLCLFLFYYNSPKLLSCFFFLQNQLKFSYNCADFPSADIFVVQTGIFVRDVFMKLKENGWAFYFKTQRLVLIYVFNVHLVKTFW